MTAPSPFTISDIEKAIGSKPVVKSCDKKQLFYNIGTNSRSIGKNDLFLALKGERFDGADFVPELIDAGIRGFIVPRGFLNHLPEKKKKDLKSKNNEISLFETSNSLTALGLLANFQRMRSRAKIIAITGSSGKTTTREMIGKILEPCFNTLCTKGNLNNEIGLPLTLLGLGMDHEMAVVEMGMNHPGEISRLGKIALPDIAVITNTSKAHLEGLGTVDNIALAKAEIFRFMNKNSTAIINIHDAKFKVLKAKAEENNNINEIICFGTHEKADIKACRISYDNTGTKFSILGKNQISSNIVLNSPAPFMVKNALAACAASLKAGADGDSIKKGLQTFTPVKGRMSLAEFSDTINLIDDTYNANPDSVKQALITLSIVAEKNRSIAVLGDMLELGKDAENLHQETGRFAAERKISRLYTFGKLGAHIVKGAVKAGLPEKYTMNGTKKEIAEKVMNQGSTCVSWVLVKGSRGMEMEKVIHEMQKLKTDGRKGK